MRVFTEAAIKLLGNKDKSKRLISYARTLLGIMKASNNQNLEVQSWRRTLPDGSLIRVFSLFGRDHIIIQTFDDVVESDVFTTYFTYGPRVLNALSLIAQDTIELSAKFSVPPYNNRIVEAATVTLPEIVNRATTAIEVEDEAYPIMKAKTLSDDGFYCHFTGFKFIREAYHSAYIPNVSGFISYQGRIGYTTTFSPAFDVRSYQDVIYSLEGNGGTGDVYFYIYDVLRAVEPYSEATLQFTASVDGDIFQLDGNTILTSANGRNLRIMSAKISPDITECAFVVAARFQNGKDSGLKDPDDAGNHFTTQIETWEVIFDLELNGSNLLKPTNVVATKMDQDTCSVYSKFKNEITQQPIKVLSLIESVGYVSAANSLTLGNIWPNAEERNFYFTGISGNGLEAQFFDQAPSVKVEEYNGAGGSLSNSYFLELQNGVTHPLGPGSYILSLSAEELTSITATWSPSADTTVPTWDGTEGDIKFFLDLGPQIVLELAAGGTETSQIVDTYDCYHVTVQHFALQGEYTFDYLWLGNDRLLVGHVYTDNPSVETYGSRKQIGYGPRDTSKNLGPTWTTAFDLYNAPLPGLYISIYSLAPSLQHPIETLDFIEAEVNKEIRLHTSTSAGASESDEQTGDPGIYLIVGALDDSSASITGAEYDSYSVDPNITFTHSASYGYKPGPGNRYIHPVSVSNYRESSAASRLTILQNRGWIPSGVNSIHSGFSLVTGSGSYPEDLVGTFEFDDSSPLYRPTEDLSADGDAAAEVTAHPADLELLIAEESDTTGAAWAIVAVENDTTHFIAGGETAVVWDDPLIKGPERVFDTINGQPLNIIQLDYDNTRADLLDIDDNLYTVYTDDLYRSVIDLYPIGRNNNQAMIFKIAENTEAGTSRWVIGGHQFLGSEFPTGPWSFLYYTDEDFNILTDFSTVETEDGDTIINDTGLNFASNRSYAGLDTR